MNKKTIISVIVIIIALASGWLLLRSKPVVQPAAPQTASSTAATSTTQGPTGIPSVKGPTTAPSAAAKPKTTPVISGSGIKGIVTIGPTCPVVPAYDPTGACADKPFAGKFEIKSSIGTVVKTFSTGSNGVFSVALPTGAYSIEPMPGTLYPRMIPANNIIVKTNQYTSVTVKFDTGIR